MSVCYEQSFLSLWFYQVFHLGEEPLSHRNSVHIKVMTSHQANWSMSDQITKINYRACSMLH